jgi:MazG family protein
MREAMPKKEEGLQLGQFDEFVKIVRRLRRECPWDKEQTHDSIKAGTLEEAYEVVEAIDEKNYGELKKELGDLLLHVVFHASLAQDDSRFTIKDVIAGITQKLIKRHPHIFGDTKVTGAEHVKDNWEKIKLSEGRESVVDGIPKELPALLRANRLQEKVARVGFDWEKREQVWDKVEEEVKELHAAVDNQSHSEIEDELGDLLFALVNYSRFVKVNPENALRRANEKFIRRFKHIEKRMKSEGKDIHNSTWQEMDKFWDEAKTK